MKQGGAAAGHYAWLLSHYCPSIHGHFHETEYHSEKRLKKLNSNVEKFR